MSFSKHLIDSSSSIKDALPRMDILGKDAILFVIDDNGVLRGSLTDGDVRRGLMRGILLEDTVESVAQSSPKYIRKGETDIDAIVKLREQLIFILPVIDFGNRVVDVINLQELRSYLPIDAVIMAGGRGERLKPLTNEIPKPMLPVADKPIIEHNIDRLSSYGIKKYYISINYLREKIISYLGDGTKKNIKISYLEEDIPLGTIGAVSQIREFDNDIILVMNSDILTNINFEDFFFDFKNNNADFSVVSIPYQVNIPYAVLETKDNHVLKFKEKPTFTYYSNAGIYLIRSSLLNKIPFKTNFNTTDLMELLISEGYKVITYPLLGYWLDIGKPEDYKKAQIEFHHINF
jgi:dTDP-glucose pyrophosphorylase